MTTKNKKEITRPGEVSVHFHIFKDERGRWVIDHESWGLHTNVDLPLDALGEAINIAIESTKGQDVLGQILG